MGSLVLYIEEEPQLPAALTPPRLRMNQLAARRGELWRVASRKVSILEVEKSTFMAHKGYRFGQRTQKHAEQPCDELDDAAGGSRTTMTKPRICPCASALPLLATWPEKISDTVPLASNGSHQSDAYSTDLPPQDPISFHQGSRTEFLISDCVVQR
jgi:hypothetical protein